MEIILIHINIQEEYFDLGDAFSNVKMINKT